MQLCWNYPVITNNIITGNYSAAHGSGIHCNSGSPIITNNIITTNLGIGIIFGDSSSSPIISNSIIAKNSGGGILTGYSTFLTIINCTISDNSEYGIWMRGDPSRSKVLNTIIWDKILAHYWKLNITYSDILGGYPGEGNIDAAPLFVDPDNSDYHLQSGSPCIDAGTPDGTPPDDIEGNPRDEFPDMGAYEYVGPSSIEIISPADGDEFFVGDIVDVLAEVRNQFGNPVEGVEVTFETTGGTVDPVIAFTDENGQAITQLTVAEGENIVAAIVTDDIFDTVTVIGVVPVGSINGNVMDIVGRPVKFAFVIAINAETKDKYKTFTDSNGDYEIPDVLSGICWVICIKKGYKAGIKKAEVVAGGSTTVDFMLTPKLE